MKIYPTCAHSFMEFISSDKRLLNKYVTKNIIKVKPFDVTLRDGLQALSVEEREYFTTDIKKEIYETITEKYNSKKIEIGSFVNYKMMPIFSDTSHMFKWSELNNLQHRIPYKNYVLVPNCNQLETAINIGITNFSFISSISNSFQIKNTKMTFDENLNNLNIMMNILNNYGRDNYNVKLYVSCINECPIEGIINNDIVIENICKLYQLTPDKMCISDTCGSLSLDDFKLIMEGINSKGVEFSKISLHLHVKREREEEVEKIVHFALKNGINEFDVSDLSSGGCSITMDKEQISPNMNYSQYYKFLINYLLN